MRKRILSLLFVMAVAFSLLPMMTIPAFAADGAQIGARGASELALDAENYEIYCMPAEGGSASGPYEAAEGQTVTVTVHPNTGREFSYLSLYPDVGYTSIGNNQYQFTMPASAVQVTPHFSWISYDTTVNEVPEGKGKIAVDKSTANYENEVKLTVTDVPIGYKLTFDVKDESGNTVTVSPASGGNGEYTFKMPASDVTISATVGDAFTLVDADQKLYKDDDGTYYQKDDSGAYNEVHVHTEEGGGYTVFTEFKFNASAYFESGNYYLAESMEAPRHYFLGYSGAVDTPDQVVFCMNGKTLENTNDHESGLFNVFDDSSLTVVDCVGGGKLVGHRWGGSVFAMRGAGSKLAVEDVTLTNSGYGIHFWSGDAEVKLEDVTVNITGGSGSSAIHTNNCSNIKLNILGGEFTVTDQYAYAFSFYFNEDETNSRITVEDAAIRGGWGVRLDSKIKDPEQIYFKNCAIEEISIDAGSAVLDGGKVTDGVYVERAHKTYYDRSNVLVLRSAPEAKFLYVANVTWQGASTFYSPYYIIGTGMIDSGRTYTVSIYETANGGEEYIFAVPENDTVDLSGYASSFTTPYNYTIRYKDDGNLYIYVYPYIADRDGDGKKEIDTNGDGIYEGTNAEENKVYLPDGEGGYIEAIGPDEKGIYKGEEGNRYIPVDTSVPADGKYDDVIIDKAPTDGIFEDDEGNTYIPDGNGGFVQVEKNPDGSYTDDKDAEDETDDDYYIPVVDEDGKTEVIPVEKNPDGSYTDKGEKEDSEEDDTHYISDGEGGFIEVEKNPDGSYTDDKNTEGESDDDYYIPVKGDEGKTEIIPVEKNPDDTYTDKGEKEDSEEDDTHYISDGEGGFIEVEKNPDGSYTDDKDTEDEADDDHYIPVVDEDGKTKIIPVEKNPDGTYTDKGEKEDSEEDDTIYISDGNGGFTKVEKKPNDEAKPDTGNPPSGSNPPSGDNSSLLLWTALAVISGGLLGFVGCSKKRRFF